MTTTLDLIKRSMRLLQVYAIGEEPSADEAVTALIAYNGLIGSLANSPQLVYARSNDAVTLVAGTASYTVGPSGGLVTTRPVEVLSASTITYQGVDYGLTLATLDDYNSITVKTTSGIPGLIYPQTDMPNITVYLWPVPSAAMTLNLWSTKPVTGALTLTTTLSLPPGYEDVLAYLGAEALGPEFQVPVPDDVARVIRRIRRNLKRTNTEVPRLSMPYGIPGGYPYTDWRLG